MTDRHAGYVVTLDHDIREDDARAIISAIGQLRGVVGVEPVVVHAELHIAQQRAEQAIRERLWAALEGKEQ